MTLTLTELPKSTKPAKAPLTPNQKVWHRLGKQWGRHHEVMLTPNDGNGIWITNSYGLALVRDHDTVAALTVLLEQGTGNEPACTAWTFTATTDPKNGVRKVAPSLESIIKLLPKRSDHIEGTEFTVEPSREFGDVVLFAVADCPVKVSKRWLTAVSQGCDTVTVTAQPTPDKGWVGSEYRETGRLAVRTPVAVWDGPTLLGIVMPIKL